MGRSGTDEHRLEPPIKAVIDATNRGDGQGFVNGFAKDATLSDWGELHTGRREIGAWDKAHNTGRRAKLEVTGVSRVAGEVLVLLRVTRDDETEPATWGFRVTGRTVASLDIG